ncbi:MAG: TonB-dependent receptor plug domain-containing protein, partial [Rhodospirillaceae bacterium]|nr:TonB-dependent receptor plug domain-containing protein [Rhodospirillaceae bacterium]
MHSSELLRGAEAIRFVAIGTAATLALLAVPATQAQEAGADALLEEVLVTARRREESLQDVPVAISVLTDDFIQEATVLDHFDLYAETPGVEYEERRDRLGTSPTIRGVQQTAQNVLNQKMSVFIDGAPILGNAAPYRFGDLERIEVLRGPQSSAFG